VTPHRSGPQPAPLGRASVRQWAPWALVVLLAAVCSWFTAGTTPFTLGADVAVAVVLVIAAVLALVEARTGHPWRAPGPTRRGVLWPWWLAAGALTAWELVNYAESPRRDYPTVSSIYDHFSKWQGAKAAIIAMWLALGWAIVASFAKERRAP